MTEAEWMVCTDPVAMIRYQEFVSSYRKLRLFVAACYRCEWAAAEINSSSIVLEALERYADGLATPQEVAEVRVAAEKLARRRQKKKEKRKKSVGDQLLTCLRISGDMNVLLGSPPAARDASCFSTSGLRENRAAADQYRQALKTQCDFLRDLFGNPYRPVQLDRKWQTPKVIVPAETIYQDRAFSHLPILADALEDAGCTNADILNHCRQPGEHVRGCWVIDLLTGRK